MNKITTVAIALCVVISLSACHDTRKAKNYNQKTQLDDQGVAFIMNAHEAGLAEIKASAIAEKNSANAQVQSFAGMMITDHTAIGKDVDGIAADKQVTVSDNLNTEHKAALANLAKLTGPAFDKAYVQLMVTDHAKVIEMFRLANENTSLTLHNLSDNVSPKLKMHLDEANKLNATIK